MTDYVKPTADEHQTPDNATFDLPPDDPRRTDNRGGLDATITSPDEDPPHGGTTIGGADVGTTDADLSQVEDDAGAALSGKSNSGQIDAGTRGMVMPDDGPPAAGPVEGSATGATAPRIEMTDIGLVDLNSADMGVVEDEKGSMGARVEDADGNPL